MPPRRTGLGPQLPAADIEPPAPPLDLVQGRRRRRRGRPAPCRRRCRRSSGTRRSVTAGPACPVLRCRGAAGAHLEQPQDGARRPVAVVDADHGDAGRARGQHRQQRGDALQRGAVAHRGRHRHDRRRHEAAEHAGQRALHAGDHHDGVEVLEPVEHGQQAVQAGHARRRPGARRTRRGRPAPPGPPRPPGGRRSRPRPPPPPCRAAPPPAAR